MFKKMMQALCVAAIVATGLVASASAQTDTAATKVKIQFDFSVGNTQLPAGEYRISFPNRDNSQRMLVINRLDGKETAIIGGLTTRNSAKTAPGSVTFTHYGDRYFLSRVNIGDPDYTQEVFKSRAEKDAARIIAKVDREEIVVPAQE